MFGKTNFWKNYNTKKLPKILLKNVHIKMYTIILLKKVQEYQFPKKLQHKVVIQNST